MSERERAFAALMVENQRTHTIHQVNKRGIEAAACAIRERALLDAYRALTGRVWKEVANGS